MLPLEASIHEEWKPFIGMIVASSPSVDTESNNYIIPKRHVNRRTE